MLHILFLDITEHEWFSRSYYPTLEMNKIKQNRLFFPLMTIFQFFFADELVHEKEKFKAISDELDQTFAEMSGY